MNEENDLHKGLINDLDKGHIIVLEGLRSTRDEDGITQLALYKRTAIGSVKTLKNKLRDLEKFGLVKVEELTKGLGKQYSISITREGERVLQDLNNQEDESRNQEVNSHED